MERTVEGAFGAVIRELRLAQGISQETLLFEAGRHRTYVSLIEYGKNSPSIATLWALAEALDVRPSEIVVRVEQRLKGRRR